MTGKKTKISITRDSFTGSALTFIGIIFVLAFGLFGAAGLATEADSTGKVISSVFLELVCLGFVVLGFSLIVRGAKRKRFIKLFREYAAHLAADPFHSIEQLAAAKGVTTEKAKKNLLEMINRGYFLNVYIDFDRNRLVFVQDDTAPRPGASPLQTASPAGYVSVTCHGCGATNNIIKGSAGECEFCSNALSGS